MTLDLATARTTVLDHLDDDNTRWSNAQIDRALGLALSQCLHDYVGGGGERFNTLLSTSSSTSGTVSLSSQNPSAIRGIALVSGTQYFPLFPSRPEERDVADTNVRTLQIRYTPTYSLPTNTAHPLVGVGVTAAPSWDTFDHWICARAALFCTVKDAELRQELVDLEARLAGSVMTMARTPKALPFPRPARYLSAMLTWTWDPGTKTISLSRKF